MPLLMGISAPNGWAPAAARRGAEGSAEPPRRRKRSPGSLPGAGGEAERGAGYGTAAPSSARMLRALQLSGREQGQVSGCHPCRKGRGKRLSLHPQCLPEAYAPRRADELQALGATAGTLQQSSAEGASWLRKAANKHFSLAFNCRPPGFSPGAPRAESDGSAQHRGCQGRKHSLSERWKSLRGNLIRQGQPNIYTALRAREALRTGLCNLLTGRWWKLWPFWLRDPRGELGQHNSVQHLAAQTGLTLLHGPRRQRWLTLQYLSLFCPQERRSLLLRGFFKAPKARLLTFRLPKSIFLERAADRHQHCEMERSSGEAPHHPTTIYA